ncbi:hypothetical protein NPIL_685221 [Nephila pilipes]|uniref:Uncharacterized protein n=1 Tax=Nephila pilipes TaxID=299642 RepID=A0A8X6MAE1_NEPPI|nr:hypothetical protein NPIL_685221 [Nephila pilipes]
MPWNHPQTRLIRRHRIIFQSKNNKPSMSEEPGERAGTAHQGIMDVACARPSPQPRCNPLSAISVFNLLDPGATSPWLPIVANRFLNLNRDGEA